MKSLRWLCVVLTFSVLASESWAQSQAFTYQGQLKLQGVPLSGLVDMKFTLFGTESATQPVAGPILFNGISLSPIQVTNGLFSAELDFGPGALQLGQWIKIEVRSPHSPNNTGAFTALTPRQKISAAPFALSVPGLESNGNGVEVEGDVHAVGEVIASAFSSNSPLIFKVNPSNTECARFDDANCYMGLGTTDPGARLHIGGTPGVDGIMFPDGSIQTTAAGGGGGGYWSANGTHIYKNNGGNVGIGINNPEHLLDVGGRMRSRGSGGSGGGLWFTESATSTSNQSFVGRGADNQDWTGIFANGAWQFMVGDAGNVDLRGHLTIDPGTSPVLYTGTGNAELNRYLQLINTAQSPSASGLKAGGVLVSDSYAFANPGKNDLIVKGSVGVGGTSTLSKVTAHAPGYGFLQVDGSVQVGTYANASGGWIGTRSNHPFHFFTGNSMPLMTLNTVGDLGVGTSVPGRRMHVSAGGLFTAMFENSHANAAVVEFRSGSSNNVWEYGVTGSAPPFGLGAGDLYFYRQGNSEPGLTISRDNFAASIRCGDLRIGHATRRGSPGRAMVDFTDHLIINFASDWAYTFVHGRLKTNILEVAGADLAEKFPSSDEVQPGTVMEIDPDNAGKLRIARGAYNTRVAGVVSGAGDLQAGAVLGNYEGNEDGAAIALSGRVWVQCDAATSAIGIGDLLTTSEMPGHAMKASDREQSHGAVIGKAMTSLAQGERGLVLVLVNLQ